MSRGMLRFLSAGQDAGSAHVTLLGVPFDGTSSFRPGSRFGPQSIRMWSDVLESYSPAMDMDLEEMVLCDMGDLKIPSAHWNQVETAVRTAVSRILESCSVPLLLGGEHSISLPAIAACLATHPDMMVLQLDAHMDLRDEYQGLRHSHAAVMRRVVELVGPDRLTQLGIRSGTREEWRWARDAGTLAQDLDQALKRAAGRPVYLTVDLDVLDTSVMPETGTPEPGGMTFTELQEVLAALKGRPLAGADVVEYCPAPGAGGPSGAVAAKVVREVALLGRAGSD